jgi:ribonuclease P protein subunit RPR2
MTSTIRLEEQVRRLVTQVEELRAENVGLRAQLTYQQEQAATKEDQLRRYAADIRETFIAERARTEELHRSYMFTVRALANAVEARDEDTGKHAERVTAYAVRIAREAGIDTARQPELEFGFLLHDVGKVGVPDAILFKPGRLTPDERRVIEEHPMTGWGIVHDIDFLAPAIDVVRFHHERWDGSGYPDKLAGTDIPVSARVFAIADVLDALTSKRPYRTGIPLSEARAMIEKDAGTHFDPDMIDAYRAVPDEELEEIRGRFQ